MSDSLMPPQIHGLLFFPGTPFPVFKIFGYSCVLVNQKTKKPLVISTCGSSTLEPGCNYLPRFDSNPQQKGEIKPMFPMDFSFKSQVLYQNSECFLCLRNNLHLFQTSSCSKLLRTFPLSWAYFDPPLSFFVCFDSEIHCFQLQHKNLCLAWVTNINSYLVSILPKEQKDVVFDFRREMQSLLFQFNLKEIMSIKVPKNLSFVSSPTDVDFIPLTSLNLGLSKSIDIAFNNLYVFSKDEMKAEGFMSLEQIFDLVLKGDEQNVEEVHCLLLGYRHFMNINAFFLEINKILKNKQTSTLVRICTILYIWVSKYFADFSNQTALDQIIKLALEFKSITFNDARYQKEFKNFTNQFSDLLVRLIFFNAGKKPMVSNLNNNSSHQTILDFDAKQVALCLTQVDFERFCKITPYQLALYIWGAKNDATVKQVIKPLDESVQMFNKISFWAGTEICTQPILQNRIKTLEKMILVAKHCFLLNNFNTAMAIYAGLSNSAVSRLLQTWKGVSGTIQQDFEDLMEKFSNLNNFKNYRKILETCGKNKGVIPFLGLLQKDIMFWNENTKFDSFKNINYLKIQKITSLALSILDYQSNPHDSIVFEKQVQEYCLNLRALAPDALYKYSKLCESKDGESNRLIDKWESSRDIF